LSAQFYLIALGSNMRVPALGNPRGVLQTAFGALSACGEVIASSRIVTSAPVGPSQREYANAAAMVESELAPPDMLDALHAIESEFGRQRRGQRWRARALDLDIVLWSGGIWSDPRLLIPHPLFRERSFVLGPASEIAPHWRDPITHLSLAQLNARLTRARPLPR
jgi:2-amino-4-hydroxy-6-hydroxymethyldihydropteridine diphosphokinase